MKVLYIAGLYRKKSCSASIRNVALVNGLQESACEVSVLTVKFPEEVLDPYLLKSVDKAVNIIEIDAGYISSYIPSIYSGSEKPNKYSHIKELVKNIIYFPGIDKGWISAISAKDYSGYDLIISSSDTKTSHFVAAKIIKDNPCKWLQIWGDPWADDVGVKNKLLKYRALNAERKLLNKAHMIGYVSLPTAKKIESKFPYLTDKIKYIPRNFFKCIERESRSDNEFRLAYTGVMKGRNIKPILDAINLYNNSHKLQIILDVYGRVTPSQHTLLEDNKDANFNGVVSLEKVYEVFKYSDALLYLGNASGASQIPGKLYDYFGTNLPILALVQNMSDDVTKFIIKSERCIVSENNVDSISFEQLTSDKREFPIIRQYSPKSVATQIIDLFKAK